MAGQVIAKAGTITPHKKFLTQMYIPFVENYMPQLYSRTMDVSCALHWPDTAEGKKNRDEGKMIMPGDNVEMQITLKTAAAINEGVRFTVREGGKTVGTGVVTKIIE